MDGSNGDVTFRATDPFRFTDHDGFISRTFCARTSDCGQTAAEVLKLELEFLGQLLNRDLISEVNHDAPRRVL
jgi:hypothetical protein